MAPIRHDDTFMAIVVQDGTITSFRQPKRRAAKAVAELLRSLPKEEISCVTFDTSFTPLAAEDLVAWIAEFKRCYQQLIIDTRKAVQIPTIAVFADSFTDEDETRLRAVGAVLFDRSRASNQNCQTSEQFIKWLAENSKIAMAFGTAHAAKLPEPPAEGISPEDLQALNSNPPGMTEENLRAILRILNSQ